jgi:hypothetical protein
MIGAPLCACAAAITVNAPTIRWSELSAPCVAAMSSVRIFSGCVCAITSATVAISCC